MSKSKLLFKYRKCSDFSFENLFRNELSFCTLNYLNDAMEAVILYDREIAYKKLIKSKRFQMLYQKKICEDGLGPYYFGENCSQNKINYDEKYFHDEKNKDDILKVIHLLVNDLTLEFRNSFFVSCFCEDYQHPVMWSHYSDDSQGFVLAYKKDELKQNFYDFTNNEYPALKYQSYVFGLHKVTYNKAKDHTGFVCKMLTKSFKPKKNGINRFVTSIKNQKDAKEIVELLTNKMTEWSYENEWRLIIPRETRKTKKISRSQINEETAKFKELKIVDTCGIIAGEKIKKRDLAALAYYVEKHKKCTLIIQHRDEELLKNNKMKYVDFADSLLLK